MGVWTLEFRAFEFVSDFEIRISVVPKKGSGVLFFFVEVLDHNMLVWRRIENHNMLEREKWI